MLCESVANKGQKQDRKESVSAFKTKLFFLYIELTDFLGEKMVD